MAEPKIKYTGKGDFHNGIPARDLTTEEYDALDIDLRATVRESPHYDYAGYREKVEASKAPASTPKAPDKPGAAKDAPPPDDLTTG